MGEEQAQLSGGVVDMIDDFPAIKLKWNILNEYELCNDTLGLISSKNNNRKQILKHDVFNVLVCS